MIEAVGASVFQRWTRIEDESKTIYCGSIPPRLGSVVYRLDVISNDRKKSQRRSIVVKIDLINSEHLNHCGPWHVLAAGDVSSCLSVSAIK